MLPCSPLATRAQAGADRRVGAGGGKQSSPGPKYPRRFPTGHDGSANPTTLLHPATCQGCVCCEKPCNESKPSKPSVPAPKHSPRRAAIRHEPLARLPVGLGARGEQNKRAQSTPSAVSPDALSPTQKPHVFSSIYLTHEVLRRYNPRLPQCWAERHGPGGTGRPCRGHGDSSPAPLQCAHGVQLPGGAPEAAEAARHTSGWGWPPGPEPAARVGRRGSIPPPLQPSRTSGTVSFVSASHTHSFTLTHTHGELALA